MNGKNILLFAICLFTAFLLFGKNVAQYVSTDWYDARWIGVSDEDLPFYSHYLPVFKINYTVQISAPSQEEQDVFTGGQWGESAFAGFIYGANDERLLNKNKNIYGIENERDSSYIMIELAVRKSNSPCKNLAEAELNIYRVGFSPNDKKGVPFKTVTIPISIINKENKFLPHTVFIHSNLGETQIFIDGENKENLVADLLLNPYGRGGDFFAYPVVGDIGLFVNENQDVTFDNLKIRNFREPSNVLNLLGFQNLTDLKNTIFNPSKNSMPMLRNEFSTTGKKIVNAKLYVTARGIYDFYINGERINKDYFNPGFTQYNKTHFYQIYDVSKFLQNGKNAVGAILGEGWWSGGSTYAGENWNFFGDRQSLLAKLHIAYNDGTEQVIITNPETWKYSTEGAVVSNSFFQGEVYDATKEIPDWCKVDFYDKNWKPAKEILLKGSTFPLDYSVFSLV